MPKTKRKTTTMMTTDTVPDVPAVTLRHPPNRIGQHCTHWYGSSKCCNCHEDGDPFSSQLNRICEVSSG